MYFKSWISVRLMIVTDHFNNVAMVVRLLLCSFNLYNQGTVASLGGGGGGGGGGSLVECCVTKFK